MELRRITNVITKTLVIVAFWAMLLISLILEPVVSFRQIALALIKAVIVSGVFWVLFVMLVDTLLKTILLDAKEKNADRVEGGLSYHVTEPNSEEKAWLRAQEREREKEEREERERELEAEKRKQMELELAQAKKKK